MAIITNLQPGLDEEIAPNTPLSFDVLDPVIEQLRVFVWAVYTGTGVVEMVYDGSNFSAQYSFSEINSITGGRRFTVQRVSGWPEVPELRVDSCACPPSIGTSDAAAYTYDNRSSPIVTASAASGGGTLEGEIELTDGVLLGKFLHFTANGNTNDTTLEMFADAARTRVLYLKENFDAFTEPFVDGTPFALFDLEGNLEDATLYYRVTNNGGTSSTYDIVLVVGR